MSFPNLSNLGEPKRAIMPSCFLILVSDLAGNRQELTGNQYNQALFLCKYDKQ
jgi:hypothetical protein